MLAKADLVSGMVGEFPELQGVMGRYYALEQEEDAEVADAIAAHYKPVGPSDDVPRDPIAIAVALADKLDMLVGFWAIDEKPTGSKDPYALRRAALGIIRIVLENDLKLGLIDLFDAQALRVDSTFANLPRKSSAIGQGSVAWGGRKVRQNSLDLLNFFADRLKVHLKDQGARHDLVDAVFALGGDDLLMIVKRVEALGKFLDTEDGANLLTGTKRAINILRIEEKKDGVSYDQAPDRNLLKRIEEKALAKAVDEVEKCGCRGSRARGLRGRHGRDGQASRPGRRLLRLRHRQHPGAGPAREPLAPAEPHPRHDADRRRLLQDRRLVPLGQRHPHHPLRCRRGASHALLREPWLCEIQIGQPGRSRAFSMREASCSRCGAATRRSRTPLLMGCGTAMAVSVVARNVASEAEVDAAMATAETAGARMLKPAAKTFWGGYNGYFADPDRDILWEVAFNPHWGLGGGRTDQIAGLMISMPEHLFVYGTLRAESAHPMAHRLRVGARHIGKGRAPGLLYDFGSWPGAFFALEEKYRVIGSVFALGPNPRLLSDLDKYEGVVPTDEEREFPESAGLFHRIAIEVHLDHGGSVEAWAYALKDTPRARLIGTGDFIADRKLRAPKVRRS